MTDLDDRFNSLESRIVHLEIRIRTLGEIIKARMDLLPTPPHKKKRPKRRPPSTKSKRRPSKRQGK